MLGVQPPGGQALGSGRVKIPNRLGPASSSPHPHSCLPGGTSRFPYFPFSSLPMCWSSYFTLGLTIFQMTLKEHQALTLCVFVACLLMSGTPDTGVQETEAGLAGAAPGLADGHRHQ